MNKTIADVAVVGTVIFKLLIFGVTSIVLFETIDIHWAGKLFVLLCGAIWTAGIANIKVMLNIFGGDNGSKARIDRTED